MKTENDWLFYSADFSMNVEKPAAPGKVLLIRNSLERERWHKMPYEMIEDDNGPPLYVCGHGFTFEEALQNAHIAAARAKDIPHD